LGITPGSGPGHLALFGYDPLGNNIGRGALSALGLGLDMSNGDLAIRLNFCTLGADGTVLDRRAGRIETSLNQVLVQKLNEIDVPGVDLQFVTESQHRAVLLLRGSELDARVVETDPQAIGVPPRHPDALDPKATHTSGVLAQVLVEIRRVIGSETPANFVLMRGYAVVPELPTLGDLYGLNPVCVATYPMYKGLARAVGMHAIEGLHTLSDQVVVLDDVWGAYDYFFLHVKAPDACGEDGDFDGKVSAIEDVDERLIEIVEHAPDVLVVTGDHSTPSRLGQHSWHPSPCVFWGDTVRPDEISIFGERSCDGGALGVFPAQAIMALMLAHGGRLEKFGA
jgi:2,3-bisphosphoglycerate-independent phosphoglycerate mutase